MSRAGLEPATHWLKASGQPLSCDLTHCQHAPFCLISLAKPSFSVILRSLSISLSDGTLEGKLEGIAGMVVARELGL